MSGNAFAGRNRTVFTGCVLEGADHRRSHGNDSSPFCPGTADEGGGGIGNSVRLIERQLPIELRIARRGDSGGMGEGCKRDAPAASRRDQLPVEDKARGRRLERHRWTSYARPNIPQRER